MPDPALSFVFAQFIDVDQNPPLRSPGHIAFQAGDPPQPAGVIRIAPQVGHHVALDGIGQGDLARIVEDLLRPCLGKRIFRLIC